MPKKDLNWFLISENYGANLCPYAFHFDADYHGFKKVYGRGILYQAVGTQNGFLRQTYDLADYNSFATFIFNKLSGDKRFAKRMLKNIYDIIDIFFKFNNQILKTDLSKLTNRQLANLFEKFYKYFGQMSTWSVPFIFSEHSTPLWTNTLTEYLNNLSFSSKYTTLEIYQYLTSSKRKTYTAREKESILTLAIQVEKSKKLSKIFTLPAERITQELIKKDREFLTKLENHTQKFTWINYGFEGPLLETDYFITAIKDWLKKKKPVEEYQKIKKEFKTVDSRRNQLTKELMIDDKRQWMFWVVREFSFQKAYRKDIESHSYYAYDNLLKELGKRIHISQNQGHYLLKNEIVKILLNKKEVDHHELNERIKCNFYLVIHGKPKLLVGKQAKDFIKKIKSRPVPKGLKELNGQCACHGQVQGKVKIIKNKEDYAKFDSGDILVSYATNPNMVPLMKKSSAIITDEGGVTCHAAIVSRELGIPCIIGTRFATKILKDNQQVKVNATKGLVKL